MIKTLSLIFKVLIIVFLAITAMAGLAFAVIAFTYENEQVKGVIGFFAMAVCFASALSSFLRLHNTIK